MLVSLVEVSKGLKMKIKDITEGVLSDIYGAYKQAKGVKSGPDSEYKYEIPNDIKMDRELYRQVQDLARAGDKRAGLVQAKLDAEAEYLKKTMSGIVDPDKRGELAKRIAQIKGLRDMLAMPEPAGPQSSGTPKITGAPAGTEVTIPGSGIKVIKGKDGEWYPQTGNPNPAAEEDIPKLEKLAQQQIALRRSTSQTQNIPVPPQPIAQPQRRGRGRGRTR